MLKSHKRPGVDAANLRNMMPCSHVPTPKFGPLNFNIVLMVTGLLMGRMGVEPIQPEFPSDLANCKKPP